MSAKEIVQAEKGLERRKYEPPVLEHLGLWCALTLQSSVPVGTFNSNRL